MQVLGFELKTNALGFTVNAWQHSVTPCSCDIFSRVIPCRPILSVRIVLTERCSWCRTILEASSRLWLEAKLTSRNWADAMVKCRATAYIVKLRPTVGLFVLCVAWLKRTSTSNTGSTETVWRKRRDQSESFSVWSIYVSWRMERTSSAFMNFSRHWNCSAW